VTFTVCDAQANRPIAYWRLFVADQESRPERPGAA
jgi:hypothetical protein